MPKKTTASKAAKPAAKKTTKAGAAEPKKRKMRTPKSLRGFKDVLPEEQLYWDAVRDKATELAKSYSFGRVDLPILEEEKLFARTLGKDTDVVEKEMFSFVDKGDNNVTLRPEATASAARVYIEHGMLDRPQPVKMFYIGPMFRYDRPQAGRYRQFNQFGFEAFGNNDPVIDAQLIIVANAFFNDLNIPVTFHINSIGTPENRSEYKLELVAFYRRFKKELCEDCVRRLSKNPLRILDCKEKECMRISENAPQIIDWIDESAKEHFMKVIEYLDEVEVPYTLAPTLVRGLDYYNNTVFEIHPTEEKKKNQGAFGGGGRYDGLVELLGGREDTAGCGFAIGIERVVNYLKSNELVEDPTQKVDVFLATLGDAARQKGFKLFEQFRNEGVRIAEAFGKSALKSQLEFANKLGAPYALILGQKEVLDGTVIIRDMESGTQETVDIKKVVKNIQKRI